MRIPWATLSQIAGVLGFFGSIVVFIVTRLERRRHITYSVCTGPMTREAGFSENSLDPLLIVQITNSSARPITIDTSSLTLSTRKQAPFAGIEWHVVGQGEGQFRKLNQADNLRFMCRLTDFLRQCECLGFKRGNVPLRIAISDSESKKYPKRTRYDQEKLAFPGERTVVFDAEPKYKIVDMEYPKRTGLQSDMESNGYSIAWVTEERLSVKLAEGWEEVVATDRGHRYKLKMQDWPSDQVLIRRFNFK
jgi:hypothetical protein